MKRKLASRSVAAAQVHLHIGRLVIDNAVLEPAARVPLDAALRDAITPLLVQPARLRGSERHGAASAIEAVADALAARVLPTLGDAGRS